VYGFPGPKTFMGNLNRMPAPWEKGRAFLLLTFITGSRAQNAHPLYTHHAFFSILCYRRTLYTCHEFE
jgi:hypothetical protein